MPTWLVPILEALPTLIQEILALVQEIQQGGGTATAEQKAKLAQLTAMHAAVAHTAAGYSSTFAPQ